MFDYPSINQFEKKLERFLTYWDNNDQTNLNHTKKKQFLELVDSYNSKSTQKLTLRPYSNYIIRYLFDKDCLDKMIQNIDLLFAA
jgi:hypothetical protein